MVPRRRRRRRRDDSIYNCLENRRNSPRSSLLRMDYRFSIHREDNEAFGISNKLVDADGTFDYTCYNFYEEFVNFLVLSRDDYSAPSIKSSNTADTMLDA